MENVLLVIILPIATFVLGCFAGVYLPEKFRREDKKPKISISAMDQWHFYCNITNHGGDILDFDMEIFWLQDGSDQSRKITRFGYPEDNPAMGRPHQTSSLKKGETKKAYEFPKYSDDGKVIIAIRGKDMTGKPHEESLEVKNWIKK